MITSSRSTNPVTVIEGRNPGIERGKGPVTPVWVGALIQSVRASWSGAWTCRIRGIVDAIERASVGEVFAVDALPSAELLVDREELDMRHARAVPSEHVRVARTEVA